MTRYRTGILIVLLAVIVASCRGGTELDARVLQLSIAYSADGPVAAEIIGGRGAASGTTDVECRLAEGDQQIIGLATSNQFGGFTMPLDQTAFPQRIPTADEFATFNEIVECRPEGGSWVHPLQQPSIMVG